MERVNTFTRKDFIKQISGSYARIYCERIIAKKYGLMVQTPFLDRRLIEFLYSIPGDTRWQGGIRKKIIASCNERTITQKSIVEFEQGWKYSNII